MRSFANTLISPDQSCGLKSRNIHDQLYFVYDYIQYFNMSRKTGMIVSLDQEKCYDRIDHRVLYRLLEKNNFGQGIRSTIRTIYDNMTS